MPLLAAWLLIALVLVLYDRELRPSHPGWAWAYDVASVITFSLVPPAVALVIMAIEAFK